MEKPLEEKPIAGDKMSVETVAKNPIMSPVAWVSLLLIILIGAGVLWNTYTKNQKTKNQVSIGVITDLSGPVAYWGESTTLGANLAKQELVKDGYKVDVTFEDYQLQAQQALTAATKLVTQNKVNAIYAEFNPAVYTLAPYLKDKNTLFIYDAAPTSPLKESPNYLKSYLDYEVGCQAVAQKFKDAGMTKVGMLKMNLEPGELCEKGVRSVFGDNTETETFNLGDTDFKTQILKLNSKGAQAIVEIAFEGDTLNTLKVIKEQNLPIKYGTTDDSITTQVTSLYSNELKGGFGFGFRDVDAGFKEKIKAFNGGKDPASYYAAALAYTHIKQMTQAIAKYGTDVTRVTAAVAASPADSTIGFQKFANQIAQIDTQIKGY